MPISQKAEWKLKNKLINIVVKNEGEIFGGAVRDKYLHDDHSAQFYKIVKELIHENNARQNDAVVNIEDLYNDKEYLPHLFGRWITPNDIDACIHISKHDTLIEKIISSFGEIKKVFSRDPKEYFPTLSIGANQVRHDRYVIYPINRNNIKKVFAELKTVIPYEIASEYNRFFREFNVFMTTINNVRPITLDLMVVLIPSFLMNIEPPFGNLDFECNGLIMNKDSIRVSSSLLKSYCSHEFLESPVTKINVLTKILSDIKEKKAIFCYKPDFPWHRTVKMGSKGWNLEGFFEEIEIISDATYTGHCIMCHQDLPEIMLKMKCCDARYHAKCMLQAFQTGNYSMISTNKCVMCKKNHQSSISRDYEVLKKYIDISPNVSWWKSSHINTAIELNLDDEDDDLDEDEIERQVNPL